ncbi:MAG: PAS domain S-box-containing protein [Saprospiraceae bacterium]|jgi:PAS domain S-box-containing protein
MSISHDIFAFLDEIEEGIVLTQVEKNVKEKTIFLNKSLGIIIDDEVVQDFENFALLDHVHKNDHSKFKKLQENLLSKKRKQTIQFRLVQKRTKSFIWIELQAYARELSGQILNYYSLRNIDLDVQSENLLRQSELKHRLLFTRANDAIFIIKDLSIIDCNEKTLSMFESPGYSGISGKKLYQFMPDMQLDGDDSVLNFHYLIQKSLAGESQSFDWVFTKFGGSQFESEVSLSGFSLGDDAFVQVIVRDITARKKAQREELRAKIAERTNVVLQKEIEERKKIQEELTVARQYAESIINSSLDIIVACDKEGMITEFNDAGTKMFGYSQKEIIGKGVWNLLFKKEDTDKLIKKVIDEGSYLGEMTVKTKKGLPFSAYVSASRLINNDGETIGTVGVVKDISELKKSEFKLRESVQQKEVLLREVHHRVKNNLQVINSILKLQSFHIDDKKALLAISDCQSRIKSMAFIHESLYQSNDLAQVNFAEYLQTLCNHLLFSYQAESQKITLDLQVSKVSLSLDSGISCGLIVNELISNAFKHAFSDKSTGKITVNLTSSGKGHCLIVQDNGSGFPADVNYKKTNSLGLQLVMGLVDQIDGKIQCKNENGTKFIVNFKRP